MRRARRPPSSRSDSAVTSAAGGASRTRRPGGRRPPASRARTCRAGTGTARRRGAVAGRSPAAASAGSDAAQRSTAMPAAGSGSAASPRPAAAGGSRPTVSGRRRVAEPVGLVVDDDVSLALAGRHSQHDVDGAGEVSAQRLAPERSPIEPVGVRRAADRRRAGASRSSRADVRQANVGERAGASPPASGNSKSSSRSRSAQADLDERQVRRPSGPSGVSCTGSSAVGSSSAAGTSTGHQTELLAICGVQLGAQVGSRGSACSSTACTSVPNVAPPAARPSATAASDSDSRRRPARQRRRPRRRARSTSGLAADAGSCSSAARINPEYDVRRHAVSIARCEVRGVQVGRRRRWRPAATRSDHRLLRAPARRRSPSRRSRATRRRR